MTVVYLETSAYLAWLFDEPGAHEIADALNDADLIVTSELIRIETIRAIRRVQQERLVTPDQADLLKRTLDDDVRGWFRMSIDESVVTGASTAFPVEPVRSLDAIHLASALEFKKLYPDIKMLSLDDRIRHNKKALRLQHQSIANT